MKRILIVEHEEHMQTLLEYTITPFEDVEVDWSITQSLDEALEDIAHNHPKLLLIDADLPNDQAKRLCDEVSARRDMKIILLIRMGQAQPNPDCQVDATLHKPFEPNELRLLIGEMLGIHVEL